MSGKGQMYGDVSSQNWYGWPGIGWVEAAKGAGNINKRDRAENNKRVNFVTYLHFSLVIII